MGFPDSPDFNAPEATGIGPCARNVRDNSRISTAIAYLGPARNRRNLTIHGRCLANRVIIENGRAVGIEVLSEGKLETVDGSRITLCAGAFASPAILMRSGIGPHAELGLQGICTLVDAPGVGANLIDHPMMVMLAELSRDAIGQAPGTDHSRFSVLLRYTAAGSAEFNDM
jgi:choline dehydrogenase